MFTYEIFDNFNQLKNSFSRPNNGLGTSSTRAGRVEWYGTASLEEALSLLQKGYKDPLKKIKNISMNNNYVSGDNVISRVPYYYGSSVNLGRALKGLPKCMNKRKREIKNIPVINIFIDCGVLCDVTVEEKIEYGIKVLSLINTIQGKGYNTELYVGAVTIKDSDNYSACLIKIKSYAENLNLLQLCFPIVHPSFHRRLMFAWREHFPDWGPYSYGKSAYTVSYEKIEKLVNDTLGKNFIYINYKSVDTAIKKLENIN